MTNEEFFEAILQTKQPQIFAESEIQGNGVDWNNKELSILGDVSIAVPVTIYDNMGREAGIKVHEEPFKGELLYTPGCLLRGDIFAGGSKSVPDYMEVVGADQTINQPAYNQLVARRLLPILTYANEQSTPEHKAIINMPGLGCGQFAGIFQGGVASHLNIAIKELLQTHSENLQNIAMVRFDPYNECREFQGSEEKYGSIIYRVRPLLDNYGKTQLCHPTAYQEKKDDFSQCKLFKIVAWDHVSYPGNDFWIGSRATDDGIAAAATDSMNAFTTVEGHYEKNKKEFVMPNGSDEWYKKAQRLTATDNVTVVYPDGHYVNGSFGDIPVTEVKVEGTRTSS